MLARRRRSFCRAAVECDLVCDMRAFETSRSQQKRPLPKEVVFFVNCSALLIRHHLCAAVEPMAKRRGLQLILPFDENLPHLGQLQLRLLARSKLLVGTSRLKRYGLRSWTCVQTTRPNPFSSKLAFCAPRARDANPVLPSSREACRRLWSRYRRISSGPPVGAPLTERPISVADGAWPQASRLGRESQIRMTRLNGGLGGIVMSSSSRRKPGRRQL
jgi:hypothetical protein